MKNYLFLVLQEGGIFIYSYPKMSSNENILLSALIHAVSAIEKEIMKSDVGRYKLDSKTGTLYIYFKEPFFFVVITKEKVADRDLWAILERLSSEFITRYPEAQEGIIDESRLDSFDEIVENVLGRAERWLMSYHISELSKSLMNRLYEDRKKMSLKMRARILKGFSRIRGWFEWILIPDKINSLVISGLLASLAESEKDLHEMGEKFADFVYTNFKGVKSLLLSRDILDDWIDKDLLMSYLFGKDISKVVYRVEGNKLIEVLELEDNPICSVLARLDKKLKYSNFIAGIFEYFSRVKLDRYGAMSVRGFEDKCIVMGDESCEIVLEWEMPEEKLNELREKIKGELVLKK